MMFDVARHRLRNQRLIGAPFASPEAAVGWLGAVQAQDFLGARWAVAQRTRGAIDRDILDAYDAGAILRTHVLRPTWHLVLPADLRWMLALTAPRIKQQMLTYDRQLDLDERLYQRCNDAITAALTGGKHLTRTELAHALARRKITAAGQRLGHIAARAELDAVICSGPQRGKHTTYALVSERCPPTPALSRDEALANLAVRYFTGHGPALVPDFAWWSGLLLSDARRAIDIAGSALTSRVVGDHTYWLVPTARTAPLRPPIVHLLPNYDEYVVAYKDHRPDFDPAIAKRLRSRINILDNHIVVLDGKVIGGWRRATAPRAATVTVALATTLTRPEQRALALAVERFGQFLGLPAQLVG